MKLRLSLLLSLSVTSFLANAEVAQHTGELLYKIKETKNFLDISARHQIFSKYGISEKGGQAEDSVNVFRPSQKIGDLESIRMEMMESGAFEFVEYNTFEHEVGEDTNLSDPKKSAQYHHDIMDTQGAWSYTKGEGVVVAVCDSGVEFGHEDLKVNVLREGSWDFIDNDDRANPVTSHGTFVAGLIAAAANNGLGVAGMAPKAKILPLRIATTKGGTTIKTISDCIRYAADKGAKIINVSFTGVSSSVVADAGRYARNKGSLLVYSAGNQGNNTSWKDSPYVLAVGGSNANDELWRVRTCRFGMFCRTSGSNAGDFVDIVTPGHNIYSTTTYIEHNNGGSKYRSGSGTSYSAPILSGVAALVASARPDLTPWQIEEILKKSADKIGSGSEYYFGAGRANAFEAVKMALDY